MANKAIHFGLEDKSTCEDKLSYESSDDICIELFPWH